MHEAQQDAGRSKQPSGSPTLQPTPISLPKNRSTGNLQRDLSFTALNVRTESREEPAALPRSRFSMDGSSLSERDAFILSPLVTEPEHGFSASGLRRIRQGPRSRAPSRVPSGTASRVPTAPPSPEVRYEPLLSRASSMTLHAASSRGFSVDSAGPGGAFGEDLKKFPSESLHSFSFAHQSEELLHSRASALKKSLDFMRDRPGWAAGMQHPGLIMAQAKLSGDHDLQEIVALLNKANLLEGDHSQIFGAVTGPVIIDGENVFEKGFARQSDSPDPLDSEIALSPKTSPRPSESSPQRPENDSSETSGAGQPMVGAEDKDGSSQSTASSKDRTLLSHSRIEQNLRPSIRRTFTDTKTLSLQTQLSDVLAKPYNVLDSSLDSALLSPSFMSPQYLKTGLATTTPGGSNHAAARWNPANQAIFTTGTSEPWTILSANDLACLVFGVTRHEIRKLGILEMIRSDRRDWLKARLEAPGSEAALRARNTPATRSRNPSAANSSNLAVGRGGITAMLLSKPPARQQALKRAQTEGHVPRSGQRKSSTAETKPRGVLLCGDIVSIQKRNGATGSASLWVKEKMGYLIWVLEEIVEDAAQLTLDEGGNLLSATGATQTVWGQKNLLQGVHVATLLPKIPVTGPARKPVDYTSITSPGHLVARSAEGYGVPVTVTANPLLGEIKVSSFPHMAGIVVLSADEMRITSSNAVFTTALFGHVNPDGMHVTDLIPQFVKLVDILAEEGQVELVDGVVVPEQSFRRARAHLAFREDASNAAEALFLKPTGLPAKHADGSEIYVDVQMRVVKSNNSVPEEAIIEEKDEEHSSDGEAMDEDDFDDGRAELVYALWITYSRHLHSIGGGTKTPLVSRPATPPRQPSPGQAVAIIEQPRDDDNKSTDTSEGMKAEQEPEKKPDQDAAAKHRPSQSQIERDIKEATSSPIATKPANAVIAIKPETGPDSKPSSPELVAVSQVKKGPPRKKTIDDFVILEDMGQGAYGQVKLARYKEPPGHKVVLKYVTKKRILVDTWMRDRKLGTVPSEIHVLNFLKKDGMRHPNIVEMIDFFEDKDYYYIEMVPHGLPGMDLFDYIEMRPSMEESEVRNIFVQVVSAIHHLHTKAEVVHRDIKDENIILDGENRVKLIDFGSAAYVRNGPFDVFVGTIDYAAPEVITGQSYKGKPQDIWALGILLYTLIYKENPFYNVDEILERELRVPMIMSEGSLALIRAMLNREVAERYTIEQVMDHPWTKGEGLGVGRRD